MVWYVNYISVKKFSSMIFGTCKRSTSASSLQWLIFKHKMCFWQKYDSLDIDLYPSQKKNLLCITDVDWFLFCFFVFLAALHSLWDSSSPTRIEPSPLAVKVWSPNHWTTREFLVDWFLIHGLLNPKMWNPLIWRTTYIIPFCIRNVNIYRYLYPWESWDQRLWELMDDCIPKNTENLHLPRNLQVDVYTSFIQNCQNLKADKMCS